MSLKEKVVIETFDNGLVAIVEELSFVESVAYELVIPGGIVTDAEGKVGASLVLAEMTTKGAGSYDSRALSEAFDSRGIRHGEGASMERFSYRGAAMPEQLADALDLTSLMVRQPRFPEADLDNVKSLLLQDILSLQDNPSRRALVELSARYYPAPFNRPSMGTEGGIEQCTIASLRDEWKRAFQPKGAILSIAGRCRAEEVLALIRHSFGDWKGKGVTLPSFGAPDRSHAFHVPVDSAQLQIALAFPSAPFGHKLYFAAKVALQVLSGGMFGRLFTEVREKRGLCYAVYASHSATKEYGTVTAYSGTTPERAHETLTVLVQELQRLRGTVEAEELQRAKANLKASLVLGQESSGSRAASNAHDYWLDKRVRTFAEIIEGVNKVTAKDIDELWDAFPVEPFSLVTLGPRNIQEN